LLFDSYYTHMQALKQYFGLALSLAMLLILTIPVWDASISGGLDPSYRWAFNHFFAQSQAIGDWAVFTYGPLGFLRFPMDMGYNLFWALAIWSLLKLSIWWALYRWWVGEQGLDLRWWFLAAWGLGIFFRLDELWLLNLLLYLHWAQRQAKPYALFWAAAWVAGAFLVKLNMGAMSLLVFLLALLYRSKTKGQLWLIPLLGLWGFAWYFGAWYALYQDFKGSLLHLQAWWYISDNNLGATSLETPMNWWLLGTSLGLWLLYGLVQRQTDVRWLYLVCSLAAWAVFKYAMARAENYHLKALWDFLCCFIFVLVVLEHRAFSLRKMAYWLSCLGLLHLAFWQTGQYRVSMDLDWWRLGYAHDFALQHRRFKEQAWLASQQQLQPYRLSDSLLKIIGRGTVDIFPWELGYISANSLNYKPRPLFQVGCANHPQLDARNAAFLEAQGAEYILWTRHNWEGQAQYSLDRRYLFNEDGQTMFALLNRYRAIYTNDQVHLLKRQDQDLYRRVFLDQEDRLRWMEWKILPSAPSGAKALHLHVKVRKTWLGWLSHQVYKEPAYYIDYRLANGQEHRHRLVINNAQSGIWGSPYLLDWDNDLKGEPVEAVRLVCVQADWALLPELELRWSVLLQE
jgi:hypothetical protein